MASAGTRTLGDDHEIAADNLTAGNAPTGAIGITRARGLVMARKASSTRSLRNSCTIDIVTESEAKPRAHSAEQVAERDVDRTAGQQQSEHGFTQDLERDAPQRARARLRAAHRLLRRSAGGAPPLR